MDSVTDRLYRRLNAQAVKEEVYQLFLKVFEDLEDLSNVLYVMNDEEVEEQLMKAKIELGKLEQLMGEKGIV
jgi:hypothetical protein